MYRLASRSALRVAQSSLSPARTTSGRRFISTEPPHLRSRSWKSNVLRWGIAIAGVYYYNTSPVFADQPQTNLLNPNLEALEDSNDTSALDALTSPRSRGAEENAHGLHSAANAISSENASTSVSGQLDVPIDTANVGPEALEEEAEGEGAFNPETGEINWDCSCLGGMAHGPCGPEFREAFSCFVYSQEEPKGMECIDKFQGMRDCFQKHPDVYKDELMEDEEIDRELEAERQELAQQIAERRKADQSGERRLLEEPAPEPRPVQSNEPTKQTTTSPASGDIKKASAETEPVLVTKASLPGDDIIADAADDATDAVASSDGNSKS